MRFLKEFLIAPYGPVLGVSVLKREDVKAWEKRAIEDWSWLDPRPGLFPPWRDAADSLKALYFQRALGDPPGIAFTIHFSPDVAEDAKRRGSSFMKHAQERVARYLKHHLDRPIEFWFVIETSDAERLHLHGALAIDESLWDDALGALRCATTLGRDPPRHRAVRLDRITDGAGWTGYSTKNILRTRRVSKEKKLITATSGIRRHAEERYEADRAAYLDALNPYRDNPLFGAF